MSAWRLGALALVGICKLRGWWKEQQEREEKREEKRKEESWKIVPPSCSPNCYFADSSSRGCQCSCEGRHHGGWKAAKEALAREWVERENSEELARENARSQSDIFRI